MNQIIVGKIYSCPIDGACYQSRENAMAHMGIQHNIVDQSTFYLRERTVGGGY